MEAPRGIGPRSNLKDETGHIYGRLTVLRRVDHNSHSSALWECSCRCGRKVKIRGWSLRSGETRSCGCLIADVAAKRNLKHGHAKRGNRLAEYSIWLSMKQRCKNPKDKAYVYYGGRGICVWTGWASSFEEFIDHVGLRPTEKHSLDRIDVNGNYEPGNVRWATAKEQANNQRSVVELQARLDKYIQRFGLLQDDPKHA